MPIDDVDQDNHKFLILSALSIFIDLKLLSNILIEM